MRIPVATDFQSRDGTLAKDARITNGFVESQGVNDPFPGVWKRPGLTNRGVIRVGTPQYMIAWQGKLFCMINANSEVGTIPAGTYVSSSTFPVGFSGDMSVNFTNDSAATPRIVAKTSANFIYGTAALGPTINIAVPPATTVPGIVYIDGYFVIMSTTAQLYNSALNDPSSWPALNVITSQYESGAGVALAKSQEYVAAFKEYSVELFYDAGNPVGSPLSRVDNGFFKVGCASGTSIADIKGQIFWISQSKQKGRSVHVMNGTQHTEVATPDIQRIINNDDLATVYAYGARLSGHDLYIVTLVTTGITLCYDLDEKKWYRLTSLVLGNDFVGANGITLTSANGVATYTMATGTHGLSDGDPVLLAGWNQSTYNGIKQINYISPSSFSFAVSGSPASPATAAGATTGKPYSETYFKYVKYANFSGRDLFLHETNGTIYSAEQNIYQDDGVPINFDVRGQKVDGGTLEYKFMSTARLPGQQVADIAMIRWTDDDYQTYNAYRKIDLSVDFPEVRRCGKFRRRAFEIRHIGNTAPMYDALELEVSNG